MKKFKLLIAYDGTHYHGWQTQKNARSIQDLILNALMTALRTKDLSLIGAARTDAKVHALGQVAHFETDKLFHSKLLLLSLNGLLPTDIRILSIEEADPTFHARYSAKRKIYHYHLHLNKALSPFKRLYSHHVLSPIDLGKIAEACPLFIGRQNFSSFANDSLIGAVAKNPFRHLYRLEVKEEEGGVRLEFEGDGFFYKMVRNIVGTLLDIGKGKIDQEMLLTIFNAKDRRTASAAAPPQGLFLMQVLY